MMDQPHGRYFAQELVLEEDEEARRPIQHALDAGEKKKWWRAVCLACCSSRPSSAR